MYAVTEILDNLNITAHSIALSIPPFVDCRVLDVNNVLIKQGLSYMMSITSYCSFHISLSTAFWRLLFLLLRISS